MAENLQNISKNLEKFLRRDFGFRPPKPKLYLRHCLHFPVFGGFQAPKRSEIFFNLLLTLPSR